jgi:hypothetical protein
MAKNKTNKEVKTASLQDRAVVIPQKEKEKTLEELREEEQRLKHELEIKRAENGPSPLSVEEKTLVETWQKKKVESFLRYDSEKNHNSMHVSTKTNNGNQKEQAEVMMAAISEAAGSNDFTFAYKVLTRCIQASAIGTTYEDPKEFAHLFNAITNVLTSMKPADEIEGMLITRLIAIHAQSMYFLSCAANNEATTQGRDNHINRSTKLFRVYNETLEALMRYRRRGEQRVVVQHVNVNDGAQAMIGSFQAGGGINRKIEEPHG